MSDDGSPRFLGIGEVHIFISAAGLDDDGSLALYDRVTRSAEHWAEQLEAELAADQLTVSLTVDA